MARKNVVDLDVVRELALALPDVEEGTSWGATSFKVRGRMFACEAIHSSAEDRTLMVRIDTNLRDALLADEPDVYYLTPHYAPYPAVLVRLERVSRASLDKVLGTSWLFVGSKGPAVARRATRKGRRRPAEPRGRRVRGRPSRESAPRP
jgi:hypothetical protein